MGARVGASVGESVEIDGRVEVLGTEEAARCPSRRERLQLLAAQHASTEFEHLADRRAKGYEAHARVGDVAADAQEFVTRETLPSKGMPPRRPPVKDCRGMGVGLHVVDERRAAEEPDLPGKGWLGAYGTGWGISTEGEWNDHFQVQDFGDHLRSSTGLRFGYGSTRKHCDPIENHC